MEETFEQWKARFNEADTDTQRRMMLDMICKSEELDEESKNILRDSFEYVVQQTSLGKHFDLNQYRIYITQVKGYSSVNMAQLSRILMLLTMCGFSFKLDKNKD